METLREYLLDLNDTTEQQVQEGECLKAVLNCKSREDLKKVTCSLNSNPQSVHYWALKGLLNLLDNYI